MYMEGPTLATREDALCASAVCVHAHGAVHTVATAYVSIHELCNQVTELKCHCRSVTN